MTQADHTRRLEAFRVLLEAFPTDSAGNIWVSPEDGTARKQVQTCRPGDESHPVTDRRTSLRYAGRNPKDPGPRERLSSPRNIVLASPNTAIDEVVIPY